jgi:integrase/recombinase XerD
MSTTVTTIQWQYSQKKDGTRPVKIRVTDKTASKYYPVTYENRPLSLLPEQWKEIETNSKLRGELRDVRDVIRREEVRAKEAIEKVTARGRKPFSFERFENEYRGAKETSFFTVFDRYLESLKGAERIGTFNSYSGVKNIFRKFLGKDIECHEISAVLLSRYEKYLLIERGNTKNTVAIHMRTIKAVFNLAIASDPQLNEFYPFAKRRHETGKYQIRTGVGKKGQALKLEEVQRFIATSPDRLTPKWEAKTYWLFSFFCQGMNFRDIALLKVGNIKDGLIRYTRSKTSLTELEEEQITVPITAIVAEIIESLRSGQNPDDYLFPILTKGLTPAQIVAKAKQRTKTTNKWLKKLCAENGLPEITTYWARHTFATLLKNQGVGVEFIKEFLGHSSSKTTESYLSKLEIRATVKINEALQAQVLQTVTNDDN